MKLTDANDLAAVAGNEALRAQLEGEIAGRQWGAWADDARAPAPRESAAEDAPCPPADIDEALQRFVHIVDGGGLEFDSEAHMRLQTSDARNFCGRALFKEWEQHPERKLAYLEQVGFDVSGRDERVRCNLWAGWPTKPKEGCCEKLLELLAFLCSGEDDGGCQHNQVLQYVLRWLAYPLQHPGAKMKSALVFYGGQGTGKNLFFEAYGRIYGRHFLVADQNTLNDRFNAPFSRKLFVIADEVVEQKDRFNVKNKLKGLITGATIIINPKGQAQYEERNQLNLVFLSNEITPVVIETDDRRHAVIRTPPKREKEFYSAVRAEIEAGGIEALHSHLLQLDLTGFDEGTEPPATRAKETLRLLGMPSEERFFHDFVTGNIHGFPARNAPAVLSPMRAGDFFTLYKDWCSENNERAIGKIKFFATLQQRHCVTKERARVGVGQESIVQDVLFVPGGHEKPPADARGEWLAYRCEVFQQALMEYRKSRHAATQAAWNYAPQDASAPAGDTTQWAGT